MKHRQINIIKVMLIISSIVLFITILALIFDDFLAAQIDVIGIRIAMLIVAFASFGSSTLFSLLIYYHNRTVSRINDDINERAELFRELQFSSSNYSVIDFMDRMLIYIESSRYVDRYIRNSSFLFHMIEKDLDEKHILKHPDEYDYFSFKIPYRVIEGKLVSKITFDEIYFERDQKRFFFTTPSNEKESRAYLLYNEHTKRNNIIINLIVSKTSDFFNPKEINVFSKIKMHLHITSLLGVVVPGMSELYFTNPEQIEGDFTNTYKINSSNFIIKGMPHIDK
jgi:hypothetical protein